MIALDKQAYRIIASPTLVSTEPVALPHAIPEAYMLRLRDHQSGTGLSILAFLNWPVKDDLAHRFRYQIGGFDRVDVDSVMDLGYSISDDPTQADHHYIDGLINPHVHDPDSAEYADAVNEAQQEAVRFMKACVTPCWRGDVQDMYPNAPNGV